jgi:hypothetical protein
MTPLVRDERAGHVAAAERRPPRGTGRESGFWRQKHALSACF